MSVSFKLPPSGRDFLVYQSVVVEGASTRAAAEEAKISQTRVRQIVRRVTRWLGQTLPADDELSEEALLRLGEHIAADRLQYFYSEAMQGWRQTSQMKYANLCLRVLAAQSKLPAIAGELEALAMDAIYGPLPDDVGQTFLSANDVGQTFVSAKENPIMQSQGRSAEPGAKSAISNPTCNAADKNVCPTPPPVEDCSPSSSSEAAASKDSAQALVTNPPAQQACDKLPPAVRTARKSFLAPAHLPGDSGDSVTEIKITPETLGFTPTKNLSRKERRRQRRLAMASQGRK